MKTLLMIFAISVTTFLASCAGTMQTYEGSELPPEKVAVIKAGSIDVFNSATVHAVDGVESGFNIVNAVVLPGEHLIMIRPYKFTGITSYWAYRTVVLNAEAGHTYTALGKIIDEETIFAWIEDAETGQIVAGTKPDYGAAETTKNENVIDMPHYSIHAPSEAGWNLTIEDRSQSIIYLNKSVGSTSYQMRFGINWAASENMKTWTAKQVADDYRNRELSDMQLKGGMAGVYDLENVVMGEEIIGDKKFYTMAYEISQDGMKQLSSLYLYFPKETNIGVFIVIIYTEGSIDDELLSQSNKPEFIRVLESLQVNLITPPKYP
jgi:hypothetical protein